MRLVRFVAAFILAITAATAAGLTASQESLTARVDKVFAAFDRPDSPGCALGVYRDGKIAYARGYGMADLEAKVPIGPRTVFDVGSSGKQFTAAAILMLAADGKLSLQDDVRKYIPELPAYRWPITIAHLLHHTSGLRDYIGLLTLGGADIQGYTSAKDALDAIVRQKALNFEPGTEHLYSNSGYFLMSQIVERVSGRSLRAFAQERIFTPLGMKSTRYVDNHKELPERAASYTRAGAGFRVEKSDWEQTGDGAVNTTIEDLLLWDRNFYDAKVGGTTLVTELQKTGALANGTALTYARGLVVEKFRGLNMVSHGGSWAGYRAELIRFPDERLSVAVLCNVASAQASALARSVAAIYLEDKMTAPAAAPAAPSTAPPAAPPASADPSLVPSFAGVYFSDELNVTYRIVVTDGRVELHRPSGNPIVLRAMEKDVYGTSPNFTVRFGPAVGGQAPWFELSLGRIRGLRFTRKP